MRISRVPIVLVIAAVLAGCQSTPPPATQIEEPPVTETIQELSALPPIEVQQRIYKVAKGTQIQLSASDLAVMLGVEGVEWNENLRPWHYSTLRSRKINIDATDIQTAYIQLFSDTGLLPFYNEKHNRIFVEPYAISLKQTTKFEPSFENAKKIGIEYEKYNRQMELNQGKIATFHTYEGDSLKETVGNWATQGGYESVIWNLINPKHQEAVLFDMKSDAEIVERNATKAIEVLITQVNANSKATPINVSTDKTTNSLIIHAYGKYEPLQVFAVQDTDTESNMVRLATNYSLRLNYDAPSYRMKHSYRTVVTKNAEKSANQILFQYPLEVTVNEASRTMTVRKK